MPETIRDYLKRRTRRIMAVGIGGWLLCALAMSVLGQGATGPGPLFFVGFAVFGGAIITLLFFVKCPKCKARFGQLGPEIAFRVWGRRQVNFCPYCGVSLDERCP